jgi:superfamily I DNA and/or RNA helicase
MDTFSGRVLSGAEKEALLPDLWASLFLVVPVVSTTFASVERMLGRLPPEALGWLLIDEAGQALPQAAVGALMRTKRAVAVGDPLQIEPVVELSDTLTKTICRRFGVDPDRFNAPEASVQTLADEATPYVAEFAGRYGSRTVGVPLLVHRRCAEPMFGISNAIAYERLMVNAKEPALSAVRELIGPSRWFNIQGTAEEKWCPQEGQLVVQLLQQMAQRGINPDLYIITPFRIVQDNLRRVIRDSGVLNGCTDDLRAWTEDRVGTVHVAQGREAEAVIFVLGASAPQQTGARNWAGKRPNLLNVAVTRAKEAFYIVGNRQLWRTAGVFRELDARIPD